MLVLSVKLRNSILREADKKEICAEVFLKNTSINGVKRGCSGFVRNKNTGTCVYVDTESSCYGPLSGKTLVRFAYDTKDYSSTRIKNGSNQFVESNPEVISKKIVEMLGAAPAELKDGFKAKD